MSPDDAPPPMPVAALAAAVNGVVVRGSGEALVGGVTCRSTTVRPGDLFVCVRGRRDDGHRYAADAVGRGAVALAVEGVVDGLDGVAQILVPAGRVALSALSAAFHGHPSRRLRLVGITGTEGKTTTAFLLDSILRAAGRRTGLVGTIVNRVGARVQPADLTTPDAPDLQRLLWQCLAEGVTDVVMEVSSHALDQGRVADCEFDAAVLTTARSDHLDYHGTVDAYHATKRRLFESLGQGPTKGGRTFGVVNADEEAAPGFLAATRCPVTTFGRAAPADVVGRSARVRLGRTVFSVETRRWASRVRLGLTGRFNVANALAAATTAEGLGVPGAVIVAGLEALDGLPGRFESVPNRRNLLVIVDFAHTIAAFQEVLATLRGLGVGRIITVFGCAGDRDRRKRPAIGRLVASLSDFAIVTTDNPAHEDPADIAHEVVAGAREVDPGGDRHRVILDRASAVSAALDLARAGDAVLLAGKGHESYQLVGDHRVPYSDRETALTLLAR